MSELTNLYTRTIYNNIVFHNNRADRIRDLCFREKRIIDKNIENYKLKSRIIETKSEFNVNLLIK